MWKRCETTEVLGWIWKIVRTSGNILATPLTTTPAKRVNARNSVIE